MTLARWRCEITTKGAKVAAPPMPVLPAAPEIFRTPGPKDAGPAPVELARGFYDSIELKAEPSSSASSPTT